MFTSVSQPLVYAEALLAQFTSLSQATDASVLQGTFVRGLTELSGCELAQLYLLDATHTRLGMNAECLNGHLQPREVESLTADYNAEQLLQFALCQNRVISLSGLSGSLYETSFLPSQTKPWESLLCVPMVNQQGAVDGVLLCASYLNLDLEGFAKSFSQLGSFFIGQLHLLRRMRRPNTEQSALSVSSLSGYGLIGSSAAMRQVYALISKVLHSPYTVLLLGETGTGKELVARAIHDYGPRRAKGLIVQNCAALPENLLESELFGYRKGAFTGADRDRAGLFDAANGGTLLLDEVGDMPLSLQAKLLRVLQEKTVRPLGDAQSYPVDVRILAATHQDLLQMVEQHSFRQDLYYRLAQFPIALAALRDRQDDIIEFIHLFSDEFSRREQLKVPPFSETSLARLRQYPFPGNIRELKNMVERTLLLHGQEPELQLSHLPDELLNPAFSADRSSGGNTPDLGTGQLDERLDYLECQVLEQVLHKYHGNQKLAAQELGLTRGAMNYRLKKHHINARDWRI